MTESHAGHLETLHKRQILSVNIDTFCFPPQQGSRKLQMKSPFPSKSQDRPLKHLPSRSHALSSMAFLTRVTFVT